jgi:predicted nucleotidyltransferase
MMNPNASLPVIDGKIEQLAELCQRFHVKRLEIFGSAATGAFLRESSDLDFVVDFGDQALGLGRALSRFRGCPRSAF